MAYVVIVIRRARRQTDYKPVLEDWLWHTIFPLVSYTALVVAAIVLPGNPVPALFGHRCGYGSAPVHRHPQRVGYRDLRCRRVLPAGEQEPGLEGFFASGGLTHGQVPYIEVYQRSMGWKQERFSAGQTIKLEQLELELPVEAIYEGVL